MNFYDVVRIGSVSPSTCGMLAENPRESYDVARLPGDLVIEVARPRCRDTSSLPDLRHAALAHVWRFDNDAGRSRDYSIVGDLCADVNLAIRGYRMDGGMLVHPHGLFP